MNTRTGITPGGRRLLLAAVAIIAALATHMVAAADRPTDEDIAAAVKTELVMDAMVSFNDIDVATRDGIVILDGTVDKLSARDRADNVAATVRGVRSVVNRIEVRPSEIMAGDALARSVNEELLADPATDSYEIDVSADDDGNVTLTGTVDSWPERRLAGKVAGNVRGVTSIDNRVNVEYDTDRTDMEILSDVEESLKWDAYIDAGGIRVTVDDGAVTLSGSVASAAERNRAMRRSWVAGVSEVHADGLQTSDVLRANWKRTSAPVMVPDTDIKRAVDAALIYDPRVNPFEITTSVAAGVVTLTGVVDNLRARSAAEDNALNTAGVVRVKNHISVETTMEMADDEVEAVAAAALERNSFVDADKVEVNVTGGNADITGTVDTYFEKGEAQETVSRVMGVTSVSNDLHVRNNDHVYLYDPYVDDWRPRHHWYSYEKRNPTMTDDVIADAIRTQLWWSPFVDSDEVEVSVKNGVATLTGTVTDWSERRAAENNAFDGGAIWVRNQLEVASARSTQ
jgi:osmotically-inducible protein OsmY